MGANLVARALLVPRTIPLPARMVLVAMCLHALDKDPEPSYWGGWDTLALSLGYSPYTPAAHRTVARAIATLTEAGYIKATDYHEGSGNRTYSLVLPLSGSYKEPRSRPPPNGGGNG